MTTQQKIEFYLSKGFAVEVEFKEGKDVFYFQDSDKISGLDTNGWMISIGKEAGFWNTITKVTPIPPKPYEFKVGERVIIVGKGYEKEIYNIIDGQYFIGEGHCYDWWELAPALPEDEECEVVEVESFNGDSYSRDIRLWDFTKPDGKKLKIKVIKK